VDRRKRGTKHHLLTDGSGRAAMAVRATGANRHDVTQLLPLLDAVPRVRGRRGRPRRRFDRTQGDRAYDSDPHRRELRRRHTTPVLARRSTPHGSGLGRHRWVIERAQSWLHQPRRLKLRYERRADVHEALLELSCILICHASLKSSFC
jgi:transposase